MSGPKDYCPPPRYSIHVFDGSLNQVFQLQSKLKKIARELETYVLSDNLFQISFDCSQELGQLRSKSVELLKTPVFDYQSPFDQGTYNQIDTQLKKQTAELLSLIHEAEAVAIRHQERLHDYHTYVKYVAFVEHTTASFAAYKLAIIEDLQTVLSAGDDPAPTDAAAAVSAIDLPGLRHIFYFGFSKTEEAPRYAWLSEIAEKEKSIAEIRVAFADHALRQISGHQRVVGSKIAKEKAVIIEKIRLIIRDCEDAACRASYERSIHELSRRESLNRSYYYQELHDQILSHEKNRKLKIEIAKVVTALNKKPHHNAVREQRKQLLERCIQLLENSRVYQDQLAHALAELAQIEVQSDTASEEEGIAASERLFLKSQLIQCLKNRGYEVMDDMEVIDFEKDNDFLLQVHGQQNFLNLKFREDGSMRYVFKMEKGKDELLSSEQTIKLDEMRTSCEEFKAVLEDLRKMGLPLQLRNEKPIQADYLIGVSENDKKRIQNSKIVQRAVTQTKMKYLDDQNGQ